MFWKGASADELGRYIISAYGKTRGIDFFAETDAFRDAVQTAKKNLTTTKPIVDILKKAKVKPSKPTVEKLSKMLWDGASAKEFYDTITNDIAGDVLSAEELEKIIGYLDQAEADSEIYGENSKHVIDLQNQAFAVAAEKMGHSGSIFDTLRYVGMLFNVKTNERNGVGNMVNASHSRLADVVARGIENVYAKKGKLETATKSKKVSNDLAAACFDDSQRQYGELTGNSIYSAARSVKQQRRQVANNKAQKALIWIVDATSRTMEEADQKGAYGMLAGVSKLGEKGAQWYKKLDERMTEKRMSGKIGLSGLDNAYAYSLSHYLAANNEDASIFVFEKELAKKVKADSSYKATDAEKARLKLLENARNYALAEARDVTFHTYDKLADWLNGLSKGKAGEVAATIVKGSLPFLQTPINVAKTAVKYTPLGLAETVTVERARLNTGKISQAQFIKRVSQGLVGTAEVAIGVALGLLGVISGGLGDDKEDKYRKQLGEQSYAVNLGKLGTYTVDWMFAANPGILIGATIADMLKNRKDTSGLGIDEMFNIGTEVVLGTFKPLFELTMLSSLDKALEAGAYSENRPVDVAVDAKACGNLVVVVAYLVSAVV